MTNAYPQTIIITTARMTALAEFYRIGLQLDDPRATGDDHVGWSFGNVYFGLDWVADPPQEYPGAVSVWFEVDDLEATFERFVALGAKIKYGPTRKPWGAFLAAVYDPDGNLVGLSQRGENPV